MTISNLQQQTKQITAIRDLIRKTAAEEFELRERTKSSRKSAEKEQQIGLSAAAESIAKGREEAKEKRNSTLAKVKERRELEPQILKEKHEQRIFELNSEAEEIKEQTESKLNEAIWLAESLPVFCNISRIL